MTVWAAKVNYQCHPRGSIGQDEIEAGLGDYSADIGARVLEFYGQTFGFEYSLPKMVTRRVVRVVSWSPQDMVHVPGKGGAMENWGLVLYSYDTVMFDMVSGSLISQRNIEETKRRVASQVLGLALLEVVLAIIQQQQNCASWI